jgi:CheY-like chemotaxis protein
MQKFNQEDTKPRVLIADDDPVLRETLRFSLELDFAVEVVDSGEACLQRLAVGSQDLVLLDIEMPGIDGYETCRRLRADFPALPVIFVSSKDTLEERLRAFDSGGDDFVTKPFDTEVLSRKALRVVQQQAERSQLAAEKNSLQQMAMGFLQNMGETGVLLNFMRNTLNCLSYEVLAERLLQAAKEYGLNCHIQVRHEAGKISWTDHGQASELEVSILEKSNSMGRIFQFSNRLVVNYSYVSLLVNDMPADTELAGRIRDNMAILVESAEAIAETIGLRKQAAQRDVALQKAFEHSYGAIERLREMYRRQQMDTRFLLQGLMDNVEKTYVFLGLTVTQEEAFSETVKGDADQILQLFEQSDAFEQEFNRILNALSGKP